MNVLTNEQLKDRVVGGFIVGVLVAATASAVLHQWYYAAPRAPVGTPEILFQTPSQTVARIPTQHGGKRVDCTVTIDQAKNVWSVTC